MSLGIRNFKVTSIDVDCGLNIVPVVEFTVEGSLADTSPRNLGRLTKRLEDVLNNKQSVLMPEIKNVIHNDPATIVFWTDNTKTVVKCQEGDIYDPEKGLAMAISKKALGNQGNYCNTFKKWLPEEEEEDFREVEYTIKIDSADLINAYHDPLTNSTTVHLKEVDINEVLK